MLDSAWDDRHDDGVGDKHSGDAGGTCVEAAHGKHVVDASEIAVRDLRLVVDI
ncbi:hypothetical protein AB4114_30580 [Paenibacillus sp. 2RAB27]|uniref:hypothetical protein n=1 Tax=Paenibacillus sp. 2RAB27 TaxID=3232991 RepID=UPI003F95A120